MDQLSHDFHQALRSLKKSPAFLIAAVLVLALGIGANTAIFSVVNAVLLRPLAYAKPGELLQVWHTPPQKSFPGIDRFSVSAANYFDWKAMNHVWQDSAIFGFRSLTLTGVDRPQNVTGAAVEASFFPVLGTQPLLGRTFATGEDTEGRDNVVVLSHALWKENYGGDRNIVGREIEVNGQKRTVIGVMPEDFALPRWARMWVPLVFTPAEKAVRGEHSLGVIARMKPGVTVSQVNAELATISNKLAQDYPQDDNGWGAIAIPLREQLVGNLRTALLVLLAAVVFVLLIASTNVANLLLARTLARKREIAIRIALGSSKRRLFQQVLSESVAVAMLGGLLGLVFAHFGTKFIVSYLGDRLPRGFHVALDARVLAFTFFVAVASGVLAGLIPAWKFTHADVNEALKEGAGRTGTEAGGSRTRSGLVVAEVALAMLLLVGAGLMVRTLYNLQHTDPGFDSHHALTMTLGFGETRYADISAMSQGANEILQNVRAVPGVEAAAIIDDIPLTGGSQQPIQAEGQPVVQMADQPEVAVRTITPGYLKSMAIPLLSGRDLADSDAGDAPGAILISESMAKRIWPNQDPIGKHLTLTFTPDKVRQVVGVIGDVKQEELSTQQPMATMYVPLAQRQQMKDRPFKSYPMYLVVRTPGDPASIVSSVSAAIHRVDANLPLLEIMPMDAFIGETLTAQRTNMTLLVGFAVLALVLAAVGIYSVLAFSVRRRVREIGIRMALGAQLNDVIKLVMVEGLKPVAIGVVLGIVSAAILGRAIASMIYGVKPTDVMTLAGGSLLLLAVAMLATLIPAYRATKIVPVAILRDE